MDPKNITIKVLTMIPPTKNENFNMDGRVLTPSKGENVKLDCSIKGGARPKPIITWTKDEQVINDQNNFTDAVKFSSDYSSITFRYIQADHSGEYQCEAVNRAGEVLGKLILSKLYVVQFNLGILFCQITTLIKDWMAFIKERGPLRNAFLVKSN